MVSDIAKPLHQHEKQKMQFDIFLFLTPFCLLGHIYAIYEICSLCMS